MKKFIFLFLILFILFFNIHSSANNLKKIDLDIGDNEIFLVFMKLKNSTSLLLMDKNDSDLFIIKYKNDLDIKKNLMIFNSNPSIHFLEGKFSKKFRNAYVYLGKDRFSFRINNYTLCIYDNIHRNVKGCNFIYLISLNEDFAIPTNASIIFYDKDISAKFLEDTFESWTDSHMIDTESFSILKFDDESYSVMIIPQARY